MASSRDKNRKKFVNRSEHYMDLFESRVNKNNLLQYETRVAGDIPAALKKSLLEVKHTWQAGDKYWKLASRHYGNAKYWWVIARYNNRPTDAHVAFGVEIRIPKPLDKVLSYYR